MPRPGSHTYDVQRTRLRGRLEDAGVPDDQADAQAKEQLRRQGYAQDPGPLSDRAGGPRGERGGGGDPGDVVVLRSPQFSDHAMMPSRMTRDGDNISPALTWSTPPDGTEELVLVVEDRDVPNGPLVHWLVTGIDPNVTSIDEGTPPPRVRVWKNSFGQESYTGPLPPVGDGPHRYFFRLYALGERAAMPPEGDMSALRDHLDRTALATGTVVGLYAR